MDPTRILRNPLPPPVLVESVVADGQELPLEAPLLVPAGTLQLAEHDSGYWSQIETYVRDHSQADFTHGICPDCSEKVRRDPDWKGPGSDAARRPPRDGPHRS